MDIKQPAPTLAIAPPEDISNWKSPYIKINGNDIPVTTYLKDPTHYTESLPPTLSDSIRSHIKNLANKKEGTP